MKKRIISLFLVLSMLLCVLPAVSAAEDTTQYKFYSRYLTLNESIDINFTTNTELPDGYTVKFSVDGEETEAVSTKTKNGRPVYTYTGLTPRDLGESVTATIYDVNGGMVNSVSSTVKDYCVTMLAKDTTSDNLKVLLMDLLNYGAEAQSYFDKVTGSGLVNDGLDAYAGWTTVVNPEMAKITNDDTTNWAGAALALENSVLVRFDVYADSGDGLTLNVNIAGKTYTIENFVKNDRDYTSDTKTVYSVYFDGLNPAQMREQGTAQVLKNGEAYTGLVNFSIESCAAKAGTGEAELCKLMMKYGDAAAAYVASSASDVILYNNFNYTAATSSVEGTCSINDDGQLEISVENNNNPTVKMTVPESTYKKVSVEWDFTTTDVGESEKWIGLGMNFFGKTGQSIGYLYMATDQFGMRGLNDVNTPTGVYVTKNVTYRIKVDFDFEKNTYAVTIKDKTISGSLRNDDDPLKSLAIQFNNTYSRTFDVRIDNVVVKGSN